MYAICLDFNTANANDEHLRHHDASGEISQFLLRRSFKKYGKNLFVGDDHIDAVQAVMAVSDMSKELPWLKECVTDIQLLRIDEMSDLKPAL